MKLLLLIVLSCMVVQTVSWGLRRIRIRVPRFPRLRIRWPRIPRIPRIPIRFPFPGKRDTLPADDADVDSDQELQDAEMSFEELARLLRELPEYDETARSVDEYSMIDHDPQEHE